MNHIRSMAIAAAFLGLAAPAQASLIGDTVNCSFTDFSNLASCDKASAVVGAGAEFTLTNRSGDTAAVDIGAESISLTATPSPFGFANFNGEALTLSDLDWVGMSGEIVGITNFQTNALLGVEASDVSFTADSVTIDLGGTVFPGGHSLSFDLVTQHVAAVPLPAGLPLLLAGLAGLGVAGRRRR